MLSKRRFVTTAIAVCIACAGFSIPVFGRDQTTISLLQQKPDEVVVRVKGKGVGSDKKDALKEAFRDAVERAVGMFVDAEQAITNEDIVSSKILTHSNAYIEKYDEVSSEEKGGLFFVVIRASVRRGALVRRVQEVMPASTADLTDVNRNLYAEIVTEYKRIADSRSLLNAEFENFNPLTQLFTASLASLQPEVSSVEGDQKKVKLTYQLMINVDFDRYFGVWVPRMEKILSQVCKSSGDQIYYQRDSEAADCNHNDCMWHMWCQKKAKTEYFDFYNLFYFIEPIDSKMQYVMGAGTEDEEVWLIDAIGRSNSQLIRKGFTSQYVNRAVAAPKMNATPEFVAFLVTGVSETAISGSRYPLDAEASKVICDWMSLYSGLRAPRRYADKHGRRTAFRVEFKGKSGETVASTDVVAYNHDLSNIGSIGGNGRVDREYPNAKIPFVIYMTPFVGCVAEGCSIYFDIVIPVEDVGRIKSVNISQIDLG